MPPIPKGDGMRKQKKPQFECYTEVTTNSEGKRYLTVHISNTGDEYDGMIMYLQPAEAKEIARTIHWAALAMEQKPHVTRQE